MTIITSRRPGAAGASGRAPPSTHQRVLVPVLPNLHDSSVNCCETRRGSCCTGLLMAISGCGLEQRGSSSSSTTMTSGDRRSRTGVAAQGKCTAKTLYIALSATLWTKSQPCTVMLNIKKFHEKEKKKKVWHTHLLWCDEGAWRNYSTRTSGRSFKSHTHTRTQTRRALKTKFLDVTLLWGGGAAEAELLEKIHYDDSEGRVKKEEMCEIFNRVLHIISTEVCVRIPIQTC